MALDNTVIQTILTEKFGEQVTAFEENFGLLVFEVNAAVSHELVAFLRDDATLRFNFLTDVCGAHFPDNDASRQFAVVYHMHNWLDNKRVRIKVYLDRAQPSLASIADLFESANWQERETYDFYGINFENHPDLKRILNMDEMVSFPMRKEFPMEDQGRTDKDDRYFGRIPVTQNKN